MRRIIAVVLVLALWGCGDRIHAPSEKQKHEEVLTWLKEQGIEVVEIPERVAAKVAEGELIGDADGNGVVDYWDVWMLWHYLIGTFPYADISLLDVDGDGVVGWDDLRHMGNAIYGNGDNPHRVGFPVGSIAVDSAFEIEVVYLEGVRLTLDQKNSIRQAVDLWESIIIEDVEDYDFSVDPFDSDDIYSWSWEFGEGRGAGRIVVVDEVDDLRLLVTTSSDMWSWIIAQAGVLRYRPDTLLPVLATMQINESFSEDDDLYTVVVHEIAHALGFGSVWEESGLLRNPSTWTIRGHNPAADTYFNGPLAVEAFDNAGGTNYESNKVPVQNGGDDSHWREFVMGNEIMGTTFDGFEVLSAITIQSMADLGYSVDVSKAEVYSLPRRARGKVASSIGRCRVVQLHESAR